MRHVLTADAQFRLLWRFAIPILLLIADASGARAQTACTNEGLAKPSFCAGPWVYRDFVAPCFASKRSAACGSRQGFEQKQEPVFPKCRREAHGVERFENVTKTYAVHGEERTELVCIEGRKPPCREEKICEFPECDGRQIFEQLVPPAFRGSARFSDRSLGAQKGCKMKCEVTVMHVPVFNEGESSTCGAQIGTRMVDDPTKPIFPECRHASHGPAPGECGVVPQDNVSAFDLTLQQLFAAAPNAVNALKNPAPRCTTCDEVPLNSPADAPAKLKCLQDELARVAQEPAALDRSRLTARLVEKLKVLYELYGDAVPAAKQRELRDLYVSHPAIEPSCKVSAAAPPCAGQRAAHDGLQMCRRLLLGHVPVGVVNASLDSCLMLGGTIQSLPKTCVGDTGKTFIATSAALVMRMLTSVDREASLPAIDSLRAKLAIIERWQRAIAPLVDNDQARHAEALAAIQQMTGVLWAAAREAGALAPGATREQIAGVELEIDRRMLLAALEGAAPAITGVGLLVVLTRGFDSLSLRVRNVTAFHDLGCLIQRCGAGGTTSEISELWALWAELGNPDGLTKALANASHVRATWRKVFDAIGRHGAAVQTAIASGSRTNQVLDLSTADPAKLFEIAMPLAVLAQEATARATSFARLGRLELHPREVLRGGLSSTQIPVIENELASRIGSLRRAIDDFRINERTYLNDLQAELAVGSRLTGAKTQILSRHTEFLQLTDDLSGLRASAGIEANRFANFVEQFIAAAKREPTPLVTTSTTTVSIEARDARFTGSRSSIADLAVLRSGSAWKRRLPKGSMVTLRSSGKWSPTCAVRSTTLIDPTGKAQAPIDVTSATTGPEGFLATWQAGSYKASGNRTSTDVNDHRSTSASIKGCAGARAELKTPLIAELFVPVSVQVYASVEGCLGADMGTTWSTTESADSSEGVETRRNAMFSSGLRSEKAPSPLLPAGSLLAVRLPSGSTDVSKAAVHVVREPLTQITADEDSDLYFVVNDRAGCADVSGQIVVELTEMQMVTEMAEKTAKAMSEIIETLANESPRLIKQGRLLPGELATLRSAAYQALRVRVPAVDQMSNVLRGMFETWLDAELLKLQRDVEINAVARSIELIKIDLDGATAQLEIAGGEKRLAEQLTMLSIENVDAKKLTGDVGKLVEYLTEYVHPAFDLRYPAVLDRLSKNQAVTTKFATLTGLDFMASIGSLGRDALEIGELIRGEWDATKLTTVGSANVGTPVALSFPRPGAEASSVWAKADAARSNAVWAAIDAGKSSIAIAIRPDDLYSAIGGASRLQCTEATPIIRSMGVYLAIENSAVGTALNSQHWRVPGQIDGDLLFTTALGPRMYLLSGRDWLSEQIGVLFGPAQDAVTTFQQLGGNTFTGNGLSPLARFTVTIAALQANPTVKAEAKQASELIVVFELERQRVASPGVRGVRTCDATAAPPSDPLRSATSLVRHIKPRVLPGVTLRKRKW